MHAAILRVLTGDPDVEELPNHLEGGLPAASFERTDFLDGATIHHGRLAGRRTTTDQEVIVGEDAIFTEPVERDREVVTDCYVDLGASWCGYDTSDGEQLLTDYLLQTAGVIPEPTEIHLDAWIEEYGRRDDASVWATSYSQSKDDGYPRDRAGADFHADATMDGVPTEGVSAFGFSYKWNGGWIRGMLAASGYVAVYSDMHVEEFGRWVREEIRPYLTIAGDEPVTQSELSDASEDGVATDGGEDDA
ncbi:hypothetical protein [Halobaculum sp. EA56]|uniref:hypothetical protein n=1 Tax=Halobaculum sp. EA56 TaxID=3421648 RepID=UPI003EBBB262